MSVKLLESIRPFLDTNEKVDGVDFRKAAFIFISNTGHHGVEDLAASYYRKVSSILPHLFHDYHSFSSASLLLMIGHFAEGIVLNKLTDYQLNWLILHELNLLPVSADFIFFSLF